MIKQSQEIDPLTYTEPLKVGLYAWLNSLKERVQPTVWKPTDEQMADLWNMVCECRPADQQLLQDIYYGLKKLKEE